MAISILTSDQHRSVAVDTRARPEYGDTVNRAVALSAEFNELHREYPLLLRKTSEEPGFVAHAILGFEKDENLFVESDRWISTFIPATLARGPFSLGYIRAEDGNDAPAGMKIMIDDQHPRLRADGLPVFLPLGGESPYLEGIKRVLQTVDAGLRVDRILYRELIAMGLLEEVKIQISVFAELRYDFSGYYSINQEKLAALGADQVVRLHRLGLLAPVYFLISSLGNFQKLVNLKIARLQSA
ncbi:MAG TPA: SapC family protein [Steroidobacteraceae bacterium]|nr:SapC family protein [Steroidobacteraceae bacterium]